jgi:HSP20 family molecular chaperone IbpA
MAGSPSPEEQKRKDAEAKAKEDAEQAALPYKWTQTIGDLDITIPVPGNLKGKDLDVKIARNTLKAGIRGQEPIISVTPPLAAPPTPPRGASC